MGDPFTTALRFHGAQNYWLAAGNSSPQMWRRIQRARFAGGMDCSVHGEPLVIVAENFAPENRFAQKFWRNHTPLDRTYIRHSEIEHGGVLRFPMSAEPAHPRNHLATRDMATIPRAVGGDLASDIDQC